MKKLLYSECIFLMIQYLAESPRDWTESTVHSDGVNSPLTRSVSVRRVCHTLGISTKICVKTEFGRNLAIWHKWHATILSFFGAA